MDTESVSARLDRICIRLDQIQNQNVDVPEMKTQIQEMMLAQKDFQSQFTKQLDAVNDTLVHLTEKQTALESKTPEIITFLQQEKTFMKDQLSQAQQEILCRLTDIQTNMAAGVDTSMMSQNNKMLSQLTESMNVYSDVVMDTGVKITEQDSKLNQLRSDMLYLRESSAVTERTRSRTEQVDNTKLIKHTEQMALKIDTFLSEVRNTYAEFKGMTKAEFVWLESMIDKKLNEILSTAGTNSQETGKDNLKVEQILASLNSLHDNAGSFNKSSAIEVQQITTEIDKLNLKVTESYSSLTDHLHSVSDKLQDSVVETLGKFEQRTIKQLQELKSQNDSINSLNKTIEEDLRQLNFDTKEVFETETKGKVVDMMRYLSDLKESLRSVSSDMNRHFRETLPKECKVVSDIINTKLTDDIHQLLNLIQKVQTEIIKQAKDNTGLINKEMCNLKGNNFQIVSNISTVQEKIEAIKNQINAVETIVNKVEKKIETMADKVDKNVETIVNTVEKCFKDEINLLTQKQSEIIKQQEQSSNDVKNLIERTKHEIWAMTEKEAQLVRDRIEGPLPPHGKYTFHFYVLDFTSLIRSGKIIHSLPWYINEIKSCVRGWAFLSTYGQLEVGLIRGRHPLCVGLQPVTGDKFLEVKATICDINNNTLPDLELGEETWTTDETRIPGHIHLGWGTKLGGTSCDDLVHKGYGDKEGYGLGAVLIRYDVTVV